MEFVEETSSLHSCTAKMQGKSYLGLQISKQLEIRFQAALFRLALCLSCQLHLIPPKP